MKNLKMELALVLFIIGCSPQKPNIQKEWAKMHHSNSKSIEKFNDNKFGMFVHFGMFSILAGFECYVIVISIPLFGLFKVFDQNRFHKQMVSML